MLIEVMRPNGPAAGMSRLIEVPESLITQDAPVAAARVLAFRFAHDRKEIDFSEVVRNTFVAEVTTLTAQDLRRFGDG